MSLLDLDAMLGQSLSTTEAAPDFITPENGSYIFEVKDTKASKKEVKDKAAALKEGKPTEYVSLEFTYVIAEVIDQEGHPIKPGSLFSERFIFSEQGLPYFKARVRDIAVASGGSEEDADSLSIKEALEAVKGIRFAVDVRLNKRVVNGNELVNARLNNIRAPE